MQKCLDFWAQVYRHVVLITFYKSFKKKDRLVRDIAVMFEINSDVVQQYNE